MSLISVFARYVNIPTISNELKLVNMVILTFDLSLKVI